jgi:hypothetical protein
VRGELPQLIAVAAPPSAVAVAAFVDSSSRRRPSSPR